MLLRIIFLLLLIFFTASCTPEQLKVQKEQPPPSKDAYYLYILGYNAEKEGKWEDALAYYNKALAEDPSSAYLRTQISYMLLRTGRITEATSLAEDVVRTEPDYVPALLLLKELYGSKKRPEE